MTTHTHTHTRLTTAAGMKPSTSTVLVLTVVPTCVCVVRLRTIIDTFDEDTAPRRRPTAGERGDWRLAIGEKLNRENRIVIR